MIVIEKMEIGAAPADFDFGLTGQGGPGQWVITRDASASGGRAIEQSSADRTDYRFPLAIYKPFRPRTSMFHCGSKRSLEASIRPAASRCALLIRQLLRSARQCA